MADPGDTSRKKPDPTLMAARHAGVVNDISTRTGQRKAVIGVATTIVIGSAFVAGIWTLVVPILLFVCAIKWDQHDRRIGQQARYKRLLEREMQKDDGVLGNEDYLDMNDPDRSYNKRWTLSQIGNRALFPALELTTTVIGLARYINSKNHPSWTTALVVLGVIVGVSLAAFTWIKVDNKRTPVPSTERLISETPSEPQQ
jgi:hypothetical protein